MQQTWHAPGQERIEGVISDQDAVDELGDAREHEEHQE